MDIPTIARGLTKAQREALCEVRWIHPGGMDPIALVNSPEEPWPMGVALLFTLKTDRLTPLGLALRTYLKEQSDG